MSEVIRLSLFPETLAEYPGETSPLSENVVRTLRSEDELWREFEHKVRKNVNRARGSGVTMKIDLAGDSLDSFLAIYTSTMERRNAAGSYYFPRRYFEWIHEKLPGQFAYFYSYAGRAVASAELVLVSAQRVYSFLGGTDAQWFNVRPNELLKLEVMNWARDAGKKEFVIGGGYEPGDGIYRYKLSFAPHGAVPFSIGARIFNSAAYEQLVDSRRALAAAQGNPWLPKCNYFPVYRG